MKSFIIGCLLTAVAMTVHADELVSLADVSYPMWDEFCNGSRPSLTIACPAGMAIPITFVIRGDLFAWEDANHTPSALRIQRTFYLRNQSQFEFSMDGETWQNFNEFFKGNLHIHLEVANGSPVTYLEINLRPKSQ